MRPASPEEERVMRAQRQADIITADQFRAAMDILEATEPCDRCEETGVYPVGDPHEAPCEKCEGSGQMYTLR